MTTIETKKSIIVSGRGGKREGIGDQGLNIENPSLDRSTEHLPQLQGREGSVKYRQMSRGDPIIGMLLRAHKNPVRSACWSIDKHDDSDEIEELAIDVLSSWIFEDCPLTWDTMLGQILSFLEYGFSCFEVVWRPYDYNGNKYLVPFLSQRLQTSIENIWPDKGIVRQTTIKSGMLEIPIEDLVFFTINQQGEDLRGESLLRSAYPSWERKQVKEMYMNIGFQRGASGIPKGTVPKNVDVNDPNYIAFETLLKNLTVHEEAYIILTEGYQVEMMNTNFNAEQFQKAIESDNTQMSLSVLAQFVLLGQGGKGGAYALSRDQSDFFLDGLQYVVGLIEHVIHKDVIIPFLKINFGDAVDATRVKIKGDNLNKKAGEELSTVLANLKNGGFIKPTVDDEVKLRKYLEMPELTKEEIEQRKQQKENPPFPPAQPETDPDTGNIGEPEKGNENPEDDEEANRASAAAVKFAEAKIDKQRKQYVEITVKEVQDFMKAHLLMIKDKFMADIKNTLNRGTVEIQGLKNIELSTTKYRQALERKLSGIALDSFNRAKAGAKANSVKFADVNPKDVPKKSLKAYILNTANSIVDEQAFRLKNRAILTASSGPVKGYSVNQTVSNVERVIDEFIDSNAVVVSGSLVVVDTANFGEMEFYKDIEDQIWGYEFVAIDDDKTSEICAWHNGKTYSVNSTELAEVSPPLHSNCRSHLRPIYKSEARPEIDNAISPPSIRKQKNIL